MPLECQRLALWESSVHSIKRLDPSPFWVMAPTCVATSCAADPNLRHGLHTLSRPRHGILEACAFDDHPRARGGIPVEWQARSAEA